MLDINSALSRRTFLSGSVAAFPAGVIWAAASSAAHANPDDAIEVAERETLPPGNIPCERVPAGEPGDYKPCVAKLPDGELLLTAFHQYMKEGNKVLEQTLLFRSSDGGKSWSKPEALELLGREPYLTVLTDGTIFITGHLLAQD